MGGRRTRTILLDSTEDVVDVVGEESFGIEHGLDQAGNRSQRHVLCMCVSVPLESQNVSVWFGGEEQSNTSRRCLTFLTNMLPSAAKPFTARTARSVLSRREESGSTGTRAWGEIWDIQPEDLRGISGLNAVALALSRVAGDD